MRPRLLSARSSAHQRQSPQQRAHSWAPAPAAWSPETRAGPAGPVRARPQPHSDAARLYLQTSTGCSLCRGCLQNPREEGRVQCGWEASPRHVTSGLPSLSKHPVPNLQKGLLGAQPPWTREDCRRPTPSQPLLAQRLPVFWGLCQGLSWGHLGVRILC